MFEQSGTFRDVFRELGYESYSYDYENKFNETDFQLDLFVEIENAYENKKSIFDNITQNDLIIAFFPCTWFSVQNELIYSRKVYNFRTWDDEKIDKYIREREKERKKVYELLLKFIDIVNKRKLRMIFENPYSKNYLLKQKEMKQPDIIIENRRLLGDYFIKPTMFYFYNIEPKYFSEYIKGSSDTKKLKISLTSGIDRSLMHKDFAFNFIRKYILGV